jgi:lactate racemase
MIRVPWGPTGSLELVLPTSGSFAGAEVDVVWPDSNGPLEDYESALVAALDSPIDAPRLEEQVGPGSTVAIVVDDPSRWTPVREALPLALERLHAAGVCAHDITISVGVGRHAPVDSAAMQRRVGEEIAASYRCFSPPIDDLSAYDDLGSTPEGIPVRVFGPVARANLRIMVGSVLPHLQAGFGGGYKLIFPGTSHRMTLSALHRYGIDGRADPARLLGDLAAGNAMRQAIHAAAARLGPCWSISHLAGGRGQVFRIVAGNPERVQDMLAHEARRRLQAPEAPPADLVVAGNDPWPGDPMQSFKALLHHRAACAPGGVLVGLFWTDPDEIDRSFPINTLRRIAATGRAGGWTIRRLLPVAQRIAGAARSPAAFMLHWARELVVDRTVLVYAPPLHERVGPQLGPVQIFAEQDALWTAAGAAIARDQSRRAGRQVRIRVFPQGGLTYAPSRQEPARTGSVDVPGGSFSGGCAVS